MIRINVDGQDLLLPPNLQVGIEINSPLFNFSEIPGTLIYPFQVPVCPQNQRILGFAELRSRQTDRPVDLPCSVYIEGLLWKVGQLRLTENGTEKDYSLSFVSDAGDLRSALTGVRLNRLDLGTAARVFQTADIYPQATHANFPVKADGFYGESLPGYSGYLNRSGLSEGWVPFPFLVHVLRQAMGHAGYTVTGSWVEEEEVRRLVIFNTFALDNADPIEYRNHVPDITLAELLLALQNKFALGLIVNPTRRELEIVPLRQVLADLSYIDRTAQTDRSLRWSPPNREGFLLQEDIESGDGLLTDRNTGWARYRVEGGGQTISTKASTLLMLREPDSANPARSWLVPHTQVKGNSQVHDLGTNTFGLRLLSFRGQQPDSQGNPYPLGTSGTTDYAGTSVGSRSLLWDGPDGLYAQAWKPWLDFLADSREEERTMRLRITDLLVNEPRRKLMVDGTKWLLKKISLSATMRDGLRPARVDLHKVRL